MLGPAELGPNAVPGGLVHVVQDSQDVAVLENVRDEPVIGAIVLGDLQDRGLGLDLVLSAVETAELGLKGTEGTGADDLHD